jgi:hypothetical protein
MFVLHWNNIKSWLDWDVPATVLRMIFPNDCVHDDLHLSNSLVEDTGKFLKASFLGM